MSKVYQKRFLFISLIVLSFVSSNSFSIEGRGAQLSKLRYPVSSAYYKPRQIIYGLHQKESVCFEENQEFERLKNFNEDGYAFAALWLYLKWINYNHLENKNWYKNTLKTIFSKHEDCDAISKLSGFLNTLGDFQNDKSFEERVKNIGLNPRGDQLKLEYKASGMFTLDQLKQFLREDIILENQLVLVMGSKEVISIFKMGEVYYFYSPRGGAREIKVFSTDKLAEMIFHENRFYDKDLPLLVLVFLRLTVLRSTKIL